MRNEAQEDTLYIEVERVLTVSVVLSTLKPRHREVILKRYALGGQEKHTLAEISQEWGVTTERVRQVEAGAFRKLRSFKRLQMLRGLA